MSLPTRFFDGVFVPAPSAHFQQTPKRRRGPFRHDDVDSPLTSPYCSNAGPERSSSVAREREVPYVNLLRQFNLILKTVTNSKRNVLSHPRRMLEHTSKNYPTAVSVGA